jgi:hypothetical protein
VEFLRWLAAMNLQESVKFAAIDGYHRSFLCPLSFLQTVELP